MALLRESMSACRLERPWVNETVSGSCGSAVIRQVIEELSFDLIEAASEAARTVCASGVH